MNDPQRLAPSESPSSRAAATKWRRRFFLLVGLWGLSLFLMTFSTVRGIVAYPLYVSDADPSADVAYVMADGFAYWERLHAASDLYNMKKVLRIVIRDERERSMYNFVKRRSDLLVDRAIDYLQWHGVPRDRVSTIPAGDDTTFGSLSEARMLASELPDLKSIVVVTSSMHTRRSRLCFRRSLPEDVRVKVYAPGVPSESWEIDSPIWVEYVKLLVYYFVA